MIVLESYSQLATASARAAKMAMRCVVEDFGIYNVSGSKPGEWYKVTCRRMEDGSKVVACSCEQKYPRKFNQPCYHMVPAVGAHVLLAIARRSVILGMK